MNSYRGKLPDGNLRSGYRESMSSISFCVYSCRSYQLIQIEIIISIFFGSIPFDCDQTTQPATQHIKWTSPIISGSLQVSGKRCKSRQGKGCLSFVG